ncbi:MAG: hypothetical protein JWO50_494 [Candidatus Kaiserbacteria bacterium]|nr:hypothetical protein [Candidatus Kaiserbacteria bacterium]
MEKFTSPEAHKDIRFTVDGQHVVFEQQAAPDGITYTLTEGFKKPTDEAPGFEELVIDAGEIKDIKVLDADSDFYESYGVFQHAMLGEVEIKITDDGGYLTGPNEKSIKDALQKVRFLYYNGYDI